MRNFSFYLKFVFSLLMVSFFFISVLAVEVQINIHEDSKLTKLLIGEYLLDASGILEITNPSLVSKIYEFNFPIKLDPLVGIKKFSDNFSSSKFDFNFDRIRGNIIAPGETIKVNYRIYGLLDKNIYENSTDKNISILEYYIQNFKVLSNVVVNLQKPQREGYVYNENSSVASKPTNSTRRLISAEVKNPTDFDFLINDLTLYKTDVVNPYYADENRISNFSNLNVSPFDSFKVDFFDENSNDDSVYWVSSEILIKNNFTRNISSLYTIETIPEPEKEEIHDNLPINDSSVVIGDGKVDYDVLDSVLIKKSVDKTIVKSGDEFKVFLRVVNINDFDIYNLTILDEIPHGYELINLSDEIKLSSGNQLKFEIDKIKSYNTFVLTYTLKNNEDLKGITYLKPAELVTDDKSIFSEGILLINDLLPEKKVFIQKEVSIYDDDYVKIDIKVKNLGTIDLDNLLVVDSVDDNVILKEISKVFYERGSWKIDKLEAGGEWEVTYLVEKGYNMDSLPNIYGVDKSAVFGTLISSDEVVTVFTEQPKTVEKVGMFLAVGLLVFYLLF